MEFIYGMIAFPILYGLAILYVKMEEKEYNMDFIIYFLQGTLCMAAIAAGFSFICWLSTKIFKDN